MLLQRPQGGLAHQSPQAIKFLNFDVVVCLIDINLSAPTDCSTVLIICCMRVVRPRAEKSTCVLGELGRQIPRTEFMYIQQSIIIIQPTLRPIFQFAPRPTKIVLLA